MYYMAICDDEKIYLDKFVELVETERNAEKYLIEICTYSNSKMLIADIEEGKYFDLILSDIEMPGLFGIELAKRVKKYLPDVILIFITSHLQYSVDSFELSVFRYILKNTLEEKLPNALKDAMKILEYQTDKCYIIQTRNRMEKILYNRILYAKREGKNTVFTLTDHSTTRVRKSVSQVHRELEAEEFVFVDRGCIVNLSHVVGLKNGVLELKDGSIFYVSNGKIDEVKQHLNALWRELI